MTKLEHTEVLVVGGGPVGLTMSILLSRYGIDHILVERRNETSTHPKARGVSARSMEIFRRCGVAEDVARAGLPASHVSFYRGSSLVDPDFVRASPGGDTELDAVTPTPGLICAQNELEPVLLTHAKARGEARIAFGSRHIGVDERAGVLISTIEDVNTGDVRQVSSRFVVACDGIGSATRARVGIAMKGTSGLGRYLSIRFKAPLGRLLADRLSASYFLTPPAVGGFMAIDNDVEWIYQYPYTEGSDAERLSDEECAALIRTAAGIGGLDVEVIDTMAWRMDALLAESYCRGGIFLVGDAAHAIPPTGGHGMNTGIGDADNLAWKMAAVIRGEAGPALLDTYEVERRPIAEQIIDISSRNSRAAGGYRIDDQLLLGTRYRSAAVQTDSTDGTSGLDRSKPPFRADPGKRLPHTWLRPEVSTLDLVGCNAIVVVNGEDSTEWNALANVAQREGISIRIENIGDESFGALCPKPGVSGILVRPDGHIAACFTGIPALIEFLEAACRMFGSASRDQ